jgi:uncharacterized membrane protein
MSTDRSYDITLGLATVCTGLLAGLYYAFAVAVIPGLANADDRTFVTAMVEINKAIVNPVFMLSFLGAPLLSLVVAWVGRRKLDRWLIAAVALNVVAFLITAAINVPLNDDLEKTRNLGDFHDAWVAWNIVRTVATTGALASYVVALVRR